MLQCGDPFHSAASSNLFFSEDENGRISINSVQYEEMLKTFFSELKRHQVVLEQTYFEQGGDTPHTTNLVIQCLIQNFGDLLITQLLPSHGHIGVSS